MKPRTLKEWRLKIQISIELLGGYAHIPKEQIEGYTPEDLIGDMPYQFHFGHNYLHIRTSKRSPQWKFGDPKPDKPKKHNDEYVWQSLV